MFDTTNLAMLGVVFAALAFVISAHQVWRSRARLQVSVRYLYNSTYRSEAPMRLKCVNRGGGAITMTRARLWFPVRFDGRDQWVEVSPAQPDLTNAVVLRSDLPKRLEGTDECIVVLDIAVLLRALQMAASHVFMDECDYYSHGSLFQPPIAASFFDALGKEYRRELPGKEWAEIWARTLVKASKVGSVWNLKGKHQDSP